jgi:hypothetical protein
MGYRTKVWLVFLVHILAHLFYELLHLFLLKYSINFRKIQTLKNALHLPYLPSTAYTASTV